MTKTMKTTMDNEFEVTVFEDDVVWIEGCIDSSDGFYIERMSFTKEQWRQIVEIVNEVMDK